MEHFDWLLGFWMPNLNFVLFLMAGIYFLRKPLAKMALGKKETFLAQFEAAKEAKEQADAKLAEVNGRLATLDKEIAEIQTNAKSAAEAEAERIVSEAKRVSEQMRKDSEDAGVAELERAKLELRVLISQSVKEEVVAKIKESFDVNAQKAYQQKQIDKLSSTNGWN